MHQIRFYYEKVN